MQKVTENYLSKVTRYFYFVTEQHWNFGHTILNRVMIASTGYKGYYENFIIVVICHLEVVMRS